MESARQREVNTARVPSFQRGELKHAQWNPVDSVAAPFVEDDGDGWAECAL